MHVRKFSIFKFYFHVTGDAAGLCLQCEQDARVRPDAGSRNRLQLTDGSQQLRSQVRTLALISLPGMCTNLKSPTNTGMYGGTYLRICS